MGEERGVVGGQERGEGAVGFIGGGEVADDQVGEDAAGAVQRRSVRRVGGVPEVRQVGQGFRRGRCAEDEVAFCIVGIVFCGVDLPDDVVDFWVAGLELTVFGAPAYHLLHEALSSGFLGREELEDVEEALFVGRVDFPFTFYVDVVEEHESEVASATALTGLEQSFGSAREYLRRIVVGVWVLEVSGCDHS